MDSTSGVEVGVEVGEDVDVGDGVSDEAGTAVWVAVAVCVGGGAVDVAVLDNVQFCEFSSVKISQLECGSAL